MKLFKSSTSAALSNQEKQAQIMGNQMPHTHNANQFIVQHTMINQTVTQIPNHH